WLNVSHPLLNWTLTGTHTNAEWLLGQWTVWVDGDPYLATTLDVAVDGNTSCLNLTVGDVCRLQSLDSVVTESDAVSALGQTATGWAVLAAVLYALRDKHELALLLLCTLAALATTAWTAATVTAVAALRRSVQFGLAHATDNVALVDPHLDANAAESGVCFCKAVVDLSAKGVQWNATFVVTLGAGHFCAAQTARCQNLDALDLWLTDSALHSLAHRAAESHAVYTLLSDRLCNQGCFCVYLLHLKNVEGTHLAGALFQPAADTL